MTQGLFPLRESWPGTWQRGVATTNRRRLGDALASRAMLRGMEPRGDSFDTSDAATLDAFALVPVVELVPGRFSERAAPATPGRRADPDAWHAWWSACLRDAGLTRLEPIEPGSWFVPIVQLTDAGVLARVLQAKLATVDGGALAEIERSAAEGGDAVVNAAEEYLSALSGGYALAAGGTVLLEPGCCGDLTNLAEWDRAASAGADPWTALWIGHPHPMVRIEGGRLLVTDAMAPEASTPPPSPRWSLDRAHLVAELARARVELNAFAERLGPVVAVRFGIAPDVAGRVARHLAGLGAGLARG